MKTLSHPTSWFRLRMKNPVRDGLALLCGVFLIHALLADEPSAYDMILTHVLGERVESLRIIGAAFGLLLGILYGAVRVNWRNVRKGGAVARIAEMNVLVRSVVAWPLIWQALATTLAALIGYFNLLIQNL